MQDYDPGAATPVSATGTSATTGGDSGASGFVVADGDGGAVACEVTLNRPFGLGRIVPGTGVIVAAAPRGNGFPVGPVIAIDPERGTADFAGAASGGEHGTTALVAVLLDTVARASPLATATTAKRIHYAGAADTVAYEDGAADDIVAALSQRGHVLQRASALGRVNALWCSGGLGDDSDSCEASADPRGSGLAVIQAD
jgi:gamma-glutamyltranspeptidase/glutathione hydrolase